MADFNKYDPRVDSLVTETKTFWDAAIGKLSDADNRFLFFGHDSLSATDVAGRLTA